MLFSLLASLVRKLYFKYDVLGLQSSVVSSGLEKKEHFLLFFLTFSLSFLFISIFDTFSSSLKSNTKQNDESLESISSIFSLLISDVHIFILFSSLFILLIGLLSSGILFINSNPFKLDLVLGKDNDLILFLI